MAREDDTTTEDLGYRAYLLRLWRVTSDGRTIWRASLECPRTRERAAFAGLDALFDHLKADTAPAKEGGEG